MGWGQIRILYKALRDYTKTQHTIQSPNILYKDPKILEKAPKIYTKPQAGFTKLHIIRQDPNILDTNLKICDKNSNTHYFNI